MIRTVVPWLLGLLVIAFLAISGQKGVRGVTSNSRSLPETPVTRTGDSVDQRKRDCHGTSIAQEVCP